MFENWNYRGKEIIHTFNKISNYHFCKIPREAANFYWTESEADSLSSLFLVLIQTKEPIMMYWTKLQKPRRIF